LAIDIKSLLIRCTRRRNGEVSGFYKNICGVAGLEVEEESLYIL